MFKVICDVDIVKIDSKNSVAMYYDCKPCLVSNYLLTSQSVPVRGDEVDKVVDLCNRNGLNYKNPQYQGAYKKILATENLFNLKYISVFELNKEFYNVFGFAGKAYGLHVVQLFEAIIDTSKSNGDPYSFSITGYEALHVKFPFVFFDSSNSTDVISYRAGTYKSHESQLHISKDLMTYILKEKGVLKCSSIESGKTLSSAESEYQTYLTFLTQEFIAQLEKAMQSVRVCKVGDSNIAMVDADFSFPSQQKETKSLCTNLGGKMSSMKEAIELICERSTSIKKLAGNDAIVINCENYEELIAFDDNGDISGMNFDLYGVEDL